MNRFSGSLLILALSGLGIACGASPRTDPREKRESGRPAQTLDQRLQATGIASGAGTARIQVVPSKVFLPRTLTDDPLKAKMDIEVELATLRGVGPEERPTQRAPSPALKGLLREHQVRETVAEPAASKNSSPQEDPARLGKPEQFALFAVAPQAGAKEVGSPAQSRMVVFNQNREFDFASIQGAGVPFHVFDVDPSETILVELSGDEVARVRKQGKDWAWVQLDSGLMGLVRNHHVKAAGEFEVLKYLALEYGKLKEAGLVPEEGGGKVRVNLVNGAYQVTGATGKDVPVPLSGMEAGTPDKAEARIETASEFEILKNLALEYRKLKEAGKILEEGDSKVRVNLVNGAYQVTGATGKDVPVPLSGMDSQQPIGNQVRIDTKK